MDAAKALALASTDTKPIWNYVIEGRFKVKGSVIPLILVPTV